MEGIEVEVGIVVEVAASVGLEPVVGLGIVLVVRIAVEALVGLEVVVRVIVVVGIDFAVVVGMKRTINKFFTEKDFEVDGDGWRLRIDVATEKANALLAEYFKNAQEVFGHKYGDKVMVWRTFDQVIPGPEFKARLVFIEEIK